MFNGIGLTHLVRKEEFNYKRTADERNDALQFTRQTDMSVTIA